MTAIDPRKYAPAADALRGRVVLVTGAGDGIGRAVALAIAAHGGTALLLGRTVRKLESVYDEILAAGGPLPAIVPLDFEKAGSADYAALAESISKSYGRLDGLLHNAAQFGARTPVEQIDVPLWTRVLYVNVTAPMILTQACLPALRRSADASILLTTCDVGRTPRAYWGAYAVSKHAVEGFMALLADELESTGRIRVNAIDPGAVRTRRRLEVFPGDPGRSLTEPAAIVAPYLFLLGPAGAGVSGRIIDAQ